MHNKVCVVHQSESYLHTVNGDGPP